jgi:CRISPR/Cas system-associated protein Cas10 (large subunit of type III CRISPR-Cas system)
MSPFLEKGNQVEIAQAKEKYFREYKTNWRREKRKKEKEYTVSFAGTQLEGLIKEAKRHSLSPSRYIKYATIAYMDKRYIAPDVLLVRKLLQTLYMEKNSIEELVDESRIGRSEVREILSRIDEQEKAIRIALYSPKTLEQLLIEAIANDPQKLIEFETILQKIKP